jgi:hypothetical protein
MNQSSGADETKSICVKKKKEEEKNIFMYINPECCREDTQKIITISCLGG